MDKNLSVRKITLLAMLMALGAVLKMIEIGSGEFRIAIFEIPLMIAGIIGGPLYGFLVAFFADGLYIIVKGWTYSPLFSLSTALWGLLSFLTINKGKLKLTRLIIFVVICSILNFIINSFQLYLWTEWSFLAKVPIRLVVMVVKWPLLVGGVWLIYHRVLPSFNLNDKNTFTSE